MSCENIKGNERWERQMSPRVLLQPWWTHMDWCLVSTGQSCLPHTSLHCVFSFLYVFFFAFFLSICHTLATPSSSCWMKPLSQDQLDFFVVIAFRNFVVFLKEIMKFKFHRVFKRFYGFCFVNILFYSWGRNQTWEKDIYIYIFVFIQGNWTWKRKRKKKGKKKNKLKKIGKHCIYISIFLISTNLFEKVVQSVTVVLKHYTNSLLVCPALSLEHLNQQGPSNLMPETK